MGKLINKQEMKKIVTFFCVLAGILTANAAKPNPVRLIKGDPSIFKQEGIAYVVIDDHTTIIDGKDQPADVYYGNKSVSEYEGFKADVDRGHASFITYFNEKRKISTKLIMSDTDENANYTLKVNVTSMNVGNAGGAFLGMSPKSGGALINGTIQLIDNNDGEILCEFEFENIKGMTAPVFKARAISVYRYLADELLKTIQL